MVEPLARIDLSIAESTLRSYGCEVLDEPAKTFGRTWYFKPIGPWFLLQWCADDHSKVDEEHLRYILAGLTRYTPI